MQLVTQLETEIKKRESEIAALRTALATIKGIGPKIGTKPSGKRKPMSAETRAKLSRKMKALHKAKKTAAKKAS